MVAGQYLTKCVDDHVHLIPTMTKKMKQLLLSWGSKSLPVAIGAEGMNLVLKEWKFSPFIQKFMKEVKEVSRCKTCHLLPDTSSFIFQSLEVNKMNKMVLKPASEIA